MTESITVNDVEPLRSNLASYRQAQSPGAESVWIAFALSPKRLHGLDLPCWAHSPFIS
jgi:hypothetical protein